MNVSSATAISHPNIAFAKLSQGTQYMVTARLILPKYGGRKGSKGENKDAPVLAGAFA